MKPLIDRACRRFAEHLLHRPRLVLGLLLASVGLAVAQLPGLKFEFTPAAIYRGNDELVNFAEGFKRTFGYDETIALVVLDAVGPGDVLDAVALQWQREIVADLRALTGVLSVESLVTLSAPRPTLTGIELQRIVSAEHIDETAAESARTQFDTLPMVREGLLSDDSRVAGIPVFIDPDSRQIDSLRKVVAGLRTALADRPPPAGYRVRLSGLPVISVEIVDDLRQDQMTLIPLAGITYLCVLGLMFRRISGALLPLAAVGMCLSWTMATFAVTGEPVNLVTNVLPALLLIIGVSSSVQIVSCYAEEATATPGDPAHAALATIVKMTPACLLAALTTAIGFASLATAHSIVLRHFGWQAAIGVVFQYVGTLIFLGTLLRFFAPPRVIDYEQARPGVTTRIISATGFAVARHPWFTMTAALAIVIVSVWVGFSRVSINSYSVTETFPETHPSVQTLRLVERQLAGIIPLEISLSANEPGQFLDPETFHNVLEVEDAVRKLPGVLAVQSYADLYRVVLVHWPGRRVSETDRELVPAGDAGRNRLARTAGFIERFPDSFHYHDYMAADGRRARVRIRLAEIGSRKTLELLSVLERRLEQIFPADGPITARLTGEAYVNAHTLTTLIHDLFYSLLTASLVIFSLIALEFRSFRAGIVAALPNLTPLFITLGYMGLRGYDMNVGNVIVFTICLGLADDNTIHFLYRFREELAATGDVPHAIQRAFQGTGRAILATSLLLVAGTAVLMASNFVPTRRFAELTAVTIIGNLLGVLLLLPACLVLGWRVKKQT